MPSTNRHVMKTPAELEEGDQQNELQYTKEVHNLMKNPKERHLRIEQEEDLLFHLQVCNKVVWIPTHHMVGRPEQEQNHI